MILNDEFVESFRATIYDQLIFATCVVALVVSKSLFKFWNRKR